MIGILYNYDKLEQSCYGCVSGLTVFGAPRELAVGYYFRRRGRELDGLQMTQ